MTPSLENVDNEYLSGIDPEEFKRQDEAFKDVYGMSPIEYMNDQESKAKELALALNLESQDKIKTANNGANVRMKKVMKKSANSEVEVEPKVQVKVEPKLQLRAFAWGFHIQVSHDALNELLQEGAAVATLVGSFGIAVVASSGGAAAPASAMASALIVGTIATMGSTLRMVDNNSKGIYLSWTWAQVAMPWTMFLIPPVPTAVK